MEVRSSCLVKTAINSTNYSMSRLELTPWDLQLLQVDPIQRGLLFHIKPQSIKTLLDHLKNSLSHTLDFFPPLTGRLVAAPNTTSFHIECNNAGAEFIHAVAGAVSVSDILEPTYVPEIVHSLFPLNGVYNFDGTSKPLLAVQVTELLDGLFLGLTVNHVVVDGTSFWHFLESWSEISRGFDTISKTPVFTRWVPHNVDDLALIRLPTLDKNPWNDFVSPPLLERVFFFSKESLSKLKAKANGEAGTHKISSLQALLAHLWRTNARCRSFNDPCSIYLAVGARERIPLQEGYFGNASYGAGTALTKADLGLGHVALEINKLVEEQTSEAAKKFVEEWVRKPSFYGKGGYRFTVTGSPRFNVYGIDFGWGNPVGSRTGKMGRYDGRITLCPAVVAGCIDVELCMAPEVLRAFGDDAEFMEAL